MPNPKSVEQRTVRFIATMEDSLTIYINKTSDFTDLENEIRYLLNNTVGVENLLISAYALLFKYYNYLKCAAEKANTSIKKLTEIQLNESLNVYINKKIIGTDKLNPETRTTILYQYAGELLTYQHSQRVAKEEIFTSITHGKPHKALLHIFQRSFAELIFGKERLIPKTIYLYISFFNDFVFEPIVPSFDAKLNSEAIKFVTITGILRDLAEQNFIPAYHLLASHLPDETERQEFLQKALANHYSVTQITLCEQYLNALITSCGKDNTFILPDGVNEITIINFLRANLAQGFSSAINLKIEFFIKVKNLAEKFADNSATTEKELQDLLHLTQIVESITTGAATSTIQSSKEIGPFLRKIEAQLAEEIKTAKQQSLDDKFYFFTHEGNKTISSLEMILVSAENLQSFLAKSVYKTLFPSFSNFFMPITETEQQSIIIYAAATDDQKSKNKTLSISLGQKSPTSIFIIPAIHAIKSLSEIIAQVQEKLNISPYICVTAQPNLAHQFGMQILLIIVNFRQACMFRAQLLEGSLPTDLAQHIFSSLKVLLPYTKVRDSHYQLENKCLQTLIVFLENPTKTNTLYAEVLFEILAKTFGKKSNPQALHRKIRGLVHHRCAEISENFQGHFDHDNHRSNSDFQLIELNSIIRGRNDIPKESNADHRKKSEKNVSASNLEFSEQIAQCETATSVIQLGLNYLKTLKSKDPAVSIYIRALMNILTGKCVETAQVKTSKNLFFSTTHESSDVTMFHELKTLRLIRKQELSLDKKPQDNDIIFLILKRLTEQLKIVEKLAANMTVYNPNSDLKKPNKEEESDGEETYIVYLESDDESYTVDPDKDVSDATKFAS